MDAAGFLKDIKKQRFYVDQVVHIERLAQRAAVYEDLEEGLRFETAEALGRMGIERLYAHQAHAINRIRQGESVVVVTSTASGKTLCYTVPVIETLAEDETATMLFIYPTKALAQDQLRALNEMKLDALGIPFTGGTYDGDTPQDLRRRLRSHANVILTNPDMLHQGILPNHGRWRRFFQHLRYVVIDEVHAYRGVFGSHLANVLRRLRRICRQCGSSPQFICSSATIANPQEHAERVCGTPMTLVDNDGAPRGPKSFVLWNPPLLTPAKAGLRDWRKGGGRRSSVSEAVQLLTMLVKQRTQTIAFARRRLVSELILRDARERLRHTSPGLARSVRAYRGGYLPEERREIERQLAKGEILGVASTNALELGIDIGSLDACLIVSYPGSVSSLWQQAGRAGRGQEESMVVLVASNAPMDQYLMKHTEYLFAQSPEKAIIDPDNPHIIVGHLRCAAHEGALSADEVAEFGPYAEIVLEVLAEDDVVQRVGKGWRWKGEAYPAGEVSLRNISGVVYTIQEEGTGRRVVGTLDEVGAFAELHTHAVYLHGGETYFVNKLDVEKKIAFVEQRDVDYYTVGCQTPEVTIDEEETSAEFLGGMLGFGDVTVTTSTPFFKKVRFISRESIGFENLDLPEQYMETVSLWFAPPRELLMRMRKMGLDPSHGLIGIANVLSEVAPLFVMCDRHDIGVTVDARNLKQEALFLYDKYPGGMGFAFRCFECFDEVMKTIAEVIRNCGCEEGCPSCVGSPSQAVHVLGPDRVVEGTLPLKRDALYVLDALL